MTDEALPAFGKALHSFRHSLLAWFDEHRRDLPWRRDDITPYETLVSEMMLQQTRVATVLSYYERWMQKFPTVEALAAAELDEVLQVWAGLGYYRRAKYLHLAAQAILEHGEPENARGWGELPGVGRYTAGAIGSIALGEAVPLVDGNVKRVYARLFAWDDDPTASRSEKVFWRLAEEYVDDRRPGDANQAVMELGAVVCTPRNPSCEHCPVSEFCQAFAVGQVSEFPRPKRKKQKQRLQTKHAAICRRENGEVLLVRNDGDGLLAGLWGLPLADTVGLLREAIKPRLSESENVRELGSVRHEFSHIRMTYVAHLVDVVANTRESAENELWLEPEQIDTVGVSAAMKKVLALLNSKW